MQHLVHLWSMSIELVIKDIRQQKVRDLFTVRCVITDARAISANQAQLGKLFIINFIAQIMSAVEVEEGFLVHVSGVKKPLIDLPVVQARRQEDH